MSHSTVDDLTQTAQNIFKESAELKRSLSEDPLAMKSLAKMAQICAVSIQNGGKVMLCGNGGSAADAQHIAAEFLVRLRSNRDRDGLPAMTLLQDPSTITACANDYGFDHIFSRSLSALGKPGDVLIGISTSGKSENVLQAMKAAKTIGIDVLGFLGGDGGPAADLCAVTFIPQPSTNTGRLQEAHITAGHALVEMTEDILLEG